MELLLNSSKWLLYWLSSMKVHYKYRRTGASFTKAQQEFSSGVITNRTFQSAATTAAQGAFSSN